MRDVSCFWRAVAAGTLLIVLSQSHATAQDYFAPPRPPVNGGNQQDYYQTLTPRADNGQCEISTASYNAMLAELGRRLAALEDKEKKEDVCEPCTEIDIQTKPNHKFRGRVYADRPRPDVRSLPDAQCTPRRDPVSRYRATGMGDKLERVNRLELSTLTLAT